MATSPQSTPSSLVADLIWILLDEMVSEILGLLKCVWKSLHMLLLCKPDVPNFASLQRSGWSSPSAAAAFTRAFILMHDMPPHNTSRTRNDANTLVPILLALLDGKLPGGASCRSESKALTLCKYPLPMRCLQTFPMDPVPLRFIPANWWLGAAQHNEKHASTIVEQKLDATNV